jgi:propanol-preferring alcohol dehydrogenase
VVNVIRKRSPIALDYAEHLWMEREVKSVANVTRRDVVEYLEVAGRARVRVTVNVYKLKDANEALKRVKVGGVTGAVVLRP